MSTTFEKTWQMDMNRSFGGGSRLNQQNSVWYFKAFLKGEIGGATTGLWTCLGSSDAAVGAIDAVDRWTSTFDSTKITSAAAGTAHSWMLLQGPGSLGGTVYCLLDYGTNGIYQQLNVFFSHQAFSGGSSTTRPTAPDEWGAPWNGWNFHDTSGSAWIANGFMTTEGSFHILFGPLSNGEPYSAIMCHKLSEARSEDGVPVVTFADFGNNCFTRGAMVGSSKQNIIMRYGAAPSNGITTNASFMNWLDESSNYFLESISTDATSGGYDDLPIYVVAINPINARSIRGRLADIKWAPSSLASYTVEPSTGSPVSMVVGDVWMPCNAVPI